MTNQEILNNYPEAMASGKPFITGKSKDFKMQGIDYVYIYFAQNEGANNVDLLCEEKISIRRTKQRMLRSYAEKENYLVNNEPNFGKITPQFEIQLRHEVYPTDENQNPRRYTLGDNIHKVIGTVNENGIIVPTYSHTKLVFKKNDFIITNTIPIEDAKYFELKAQAEKTTAQPTSSKIEEKSKFDTQTVDFDFEQEG